MKDGQLLGQANWGRARCLRHELLSSSGWIRNYKFGRAARATNGGNQYGSRNSSDPAPIPTPSFPPPRSEEHTSELQSPCNLVCRLLLEKKKILVHPSQIDYMLLARSVLA